MNVLLYMVRNIIMMLPNTLNDIIYVVAVSVFGGLIPQTQNILLPFFIC